MRARVIDRVKHAINQDRIVFPAGCDCRGMVDQIAKTLQYAQQKRRSLTEDLAKQLSISEDTATMRLWNLMQ